MSIKLDSMIAETGTKFRAFPLRRHLKSFEYPEMFHVAVPPQAIQAGPADNRLYVLDAINKKPYTKSQGRARGDFQGKVHPPVAAGPEGHFDHLPVESREFACAVAYASARRVLDIWEDYTGREIAWPFRLEFEKLEIVPLLHARGAHVGWGFIELGYPVLNGGELDVTMPHAMDFEAIACAVGRNIVLSEVGIPPGPAFTLEYAGFLKAMEAMIATLSLLHFHKVLGHLLDSSMGNLFTRNELGRIGELSKVPLLRVAFNYKRMSDVVDQPEKYYLPLFGALFDILIEVYRDELIQAQLLDPALLDQAVNMSYPLQNEYIVQTEFDIASLKHKADIKFALMRARDYMGSLLARTLGELAESSLTYYGFGQTLLVADRFVSGGMHQEKIRECFAWREIARPRESKVLEPIRFTIQY